jgi:hypothetical protein
LSYIFLDESGDLGFDFKKKKTSRFFVITFLFAKEKKRLEKIVKKTFRGFSKAHRKHHPGILHATKESDRIRQKVLEHLCRLDVCILSIYLNKQKVYTRLQDEKQVLYNYVANILLDRVYSKRLVPIDKPIHLIASRRETNRFLNENFRDYLKTQVSQHHQLKLEISIKTPFQEKALQVADFACWAIYRKWEFRDESYFRIIEGKILEESPLFQ